LVFATTNEDLLNAHIFVARVFGKCWDILHRFDTFLEKMFPMILTYFFFKQKVAAWVRVCCNVGMDQITHFMLILVRDRGAWSFPKVGRPRVYAAYSINESSMHTLSHLWRVGSWCALKLKHEAPCLFSKEEVCTIRLIDARSLRTVTGDVSHAIYANASELDLVSGFCRQSSAKDTRTDDWPAGMTRQLFGDGDTCLTPARSSLHLYTFSDALATAHVRQDRPLHEFSAKTVNIVLAHMVTVVVLLPPQTAPSFSFSFRSLSLLL
jgi:hypothetical protein